MSVAFCIKLSTISEDFFHGVFIDGSKSELERRSAVICQQAGELGELRRSLTRLSHIVDTQSGEINGLEGCLR